MAINAIAPFVLNARLQPLLARTAATHDVDTFIVNVSAMEGKFYRHKTPNHPHTNMAKAALNMMTRTAAGGVGGEAPRVHDGGGHGMDQRREPEGESG